LLAGRKHSQLAVSALDKRDLTERGQEHKQLVIEQRERKWQLRAKRRIFSQLREQWQAAASFAV
jgi:hypothetical protein